MIAALGVIDSASQAREYLASSYLGGWLKIEGKIITHINKSLLIGYFSFAPTGTSSRNPASTGLPSSPTDAATIIPLDSSPRSLRG
jgi:hypothetical protein